MNAPKLIAACALSATVLAIFTPQATAQQLYRIVGADGKVTFSDQPPPATANSKVTAGRGGRFAGDGAAENAALPLELRAIAGKYPVTLFTTKDCAPCGAGRSFLQSRGIPFAEKTIDNAADTDALTRQMGEASLPSLTIGGQQLKGYAQSEWAQYLDAAGYPASSKLPANYRAPAVSPMVARVEAPAAAPAAAPAQRAAPAPAATPAPASNPAGIKF